MHFARAFHLSYLYCTVFSLTFLVNASAAPEQDSTILIGLYPTGQSRPVSATSPLFVYEYKSEWITPRTPSFQVDVNKLFLRNWLCKWSLVFQSGQIQDLSSAVFPSRQEPFFLRCELSYNGSLYRKELETWYREHPNEFPLPIPFPNEQRQNGMRPELLLIPAQGVSVPSHPPRPSWIRRLFGAKPPIRLEASNEKTNMVMILIDTLRLDHTPPGGHPFILAPHIDMLASLGVFFSNSYGASSSTRPSVGSIFTGLHPLAHGAVRHAIQGAALHFEVPLLARSFQQAGYRTAAVSSNAQISPAYGFDRGFDIFESSVWESQVTPRGIGNLRTLDEPFFLYLHYMGPHQPYQPSFPWKGLYQGQTQIPTGLPSAKTILDASHALHDAYAEEITQEDRQIGKLLKELALQGILDRTAIWLVSDHGEEFWEHWWNGHGANVFEESVRTLSIFTDPPRLPMGKIVSEPVMHVDIFPTLIELFQWEAPLLRQGKSLLPLIHGATEPEFDRRPVFLHHGGGNSAEAHISDKEAVLRDGIKAIHWPEKNQWELYDLSSDPFEQTNRIQEDTANLKNLQSILIRHLEECRIIEDQVRSLEGVDLPSLSPEEIENLKAHGYMN